MAIAVDIQKRLGNFRLDVAFSGGDEVIALLGASGCGKSMTLKCIAGVERPDRGRIVLDGATLFDSEKKINRTPQERHTGLMFQNYALFPNMTVLQNIQAGAKREKNVTKRAALVDGIIESFGLSDLLKHYPHQLSGGQQQRVALARILVSSPRVLLLDEPFSALDSHLRFRLEEEVQHLIQHFGKTVILVSHDRDEVFRLSDKIAVMHDGRVETFGDKEQVFRDPATRRAAILTGCKNISRLEKLGPRLARAVDWQLTLHTDRDIGDAEYIGIRRHYLAAEAPANTQRFRVVETLENPFSYTIMLVPEEAPDAEPIGWVRDKDTWLRERAEIITAALPPQNLLLLRDHRTGKGENQI